MSTAQEYWNKTPGAALSNPWFSNKQITSELYRRITGGRPTHWLPWLMNEHFGTRRFQRMLSPGCGTGEHEIFAARTKKVAQIDAFDFSESSLQQARKNAGDKGVTVNFYQDDLNTFELPADAKYDLILCTGSAHHVRELERFFEQLHAASTPDACLVLNEYIGACYNLYPPKQVKLINRMLAAIPESLRVRNEFGVDPLSAKLKSDPSESVRSVLILPIMEQYFQIELRHDYGGGLLHPLYSLLKHSELNSDDPKAAAVVALLLEIEQILMEEDVLPTDFTFCIGRPRKF